MIIKRHSRGKVDTNFYDESGAVTGCTCNWCNRKRQQYQRQQQAARMLTSSGPPLESAPEIDSAQLRECAEQALVKYGQAFSLNTSQILNKHPYLSRYVVHAYSCDADNIEPVVADVVDLLAQTIQRQESLLYTEALHRVRERYPELMKAYAMSDSLRSSENGSQRRHVWTRTEAGRMLDRKAREIRIAHPELSYGEAMQQAMRELPEASKAYSDVYND